jgi:hypothetical protein
MNRQAGGLLLAGLLGSVAGGGVFQAMRADDRTPPVHLTKEQDRQRLMDLLKITSLRPGRNGSNRADPNYANYDESKANPYPSLPDSLTLKNGKEVTKASDWWSKRRPEIVEDFDLEVYGRVPKNVPKVKWVVARECLGHDIAGPRPIQYSSLTFCRREIALSKNPPGASSVRKEIRAATFRS